MTDTKEAYTEPVLNKQGNLKDITFTDARYQSSVVSGD